MPRKLTPEQEKEWADIQAAEASGTTVELSTATETPAETKAAEVPEVKEVKAEAAPATTETPPQQPQTPDPFANLDPAVRDYVVGLQTENTRMSQRLSKVEGHIGSLKQQLDAAKQARSEGKEAPSDAQIRKAQGDPKKFEALREEYPEFAEAIEGYLNSIELPSGEKVDVDSIRASVRAELEQEFDAKLNRRLEEISVEMAHRGWKQTTVSPEFVGWVQRQPREVQVLYTSPHSQDVIRLLDLYVETKKATETQTARLSSAAALSSSSPGSVRQKTFDEMTPEEQWDFLSRQEAAQQRK